MALKAQADPARTSPPRRPAARAALHTVQTEPWKRASTICSYAASAFAIRKGICFSSVYLSVDIKELRRFASPVNVYLSIDRHKLVRSVGKAGLVPAPDKALLGLSELGDEFLGKRGRIAGFERPYAGAQFLRLQRLPPYFRVPASKIFQLARMPSGNRQRAHLPTDREEVIPRRDRLVARDLGSRGNCRV
jgi:hypothetical protein